MAKALPRVSRKGFILNSDGPQILLLHGYTGSPYDLRPLSDFLHTHGAHVVVPQLRGHGTRPSDLHDVTAEMWIDQAIDVLQTFDDQRKIIVGGLSMGAFIAIVLAAINKKIAALLLFSPSLRLSILSQLTILSSSLGLIDKHMSFKKPSGESDIADSVARKKTPSYREMPVSGLLQFEKLRILAEKSLPEISCPLFLGFGKNDSAINAHESHRVVMENTHVAVFAKFYERSKHVVTLDYDREELQNDVWKFLSNTVGI